MRLTTLLMLAYMLNISANVLPQQFSFQVKEKSVKDVISMIEMNSDYKFLYRTDIIDVDRKVELNIRQENINSILTKLFDPNTTTYKIFEDNLIVITAKSILQQSNVTGTVTDETTGEPLIGVTIQVKGTIIGSISMADGSYSVNVPPEAEALIFSFVGYVTQEIPINNRSVIDVVMEEEITILEEIVVIGYGVQKKSNVTGAIVSVKSDQVLNRSVENFGQAIQGKVSGVQVLALSSAPGASPIFRVRGYSSNGSSDPLYIVDGLKVSNIDYLDPQSVQSVEILKDAASAAIYGAQAGNGVVLITTKTGTRGTSRLFYSTLYTIQSPSRKLDMLSGPQFKQYWMESGLTETAFGDADTDWQDIVYTTGSLFSNTLGFEGANNNGSLYVSLTYLSNDGMVVGRSDINKRFTGQINGDYQIKPWLKVGTTNSIERGYMKTVLANKFTTTGSVIAGAYFYDPTVPSFYENDTDAPADLLAAEANGFPIRNNEGKIYGQSAILQSDLSNPLEMIKNFDNKSWRTNVNGTAYVDLTAVNGLTITSRLGYRLGNSYASNYITPYYWNSNQKLRYGSLSNIMISDVYFQWENFANYLLDIGKHEFSLMAGMQYARDHNEFISASTDRLSNDAVNFRYLSYSTSEAVDNIGGNIDEASNISYFGRLGWNYNQKYFLQGSIRADAFDASKLSKSNRWGYFPSVSAAWVMTNENFIKNFNLKALSFLKLRASWGINGNVNSLSGYPYTTSVALGGNVSFFMPANYSPDNSLIIGATPSSVLPNENLSWEKSTQVDVGFDVRFFNDRLRLGFDYFNKLTTGLLGSINAPAVSGASTQIVNMGKIENYGYEFELSWKNNIGNFSYGLDANLSTLHNEVIESPYGEGRQAGGGGFLTQATYFEQGYPIWYLRTYMVDHIDLMTGQPVYKTAEELGSDDGKAFAGSGIPDFTYGITLNLAYKGFDFRVFGTGAQGSELFLALIRMDLPKCNLPSFFYDDRWTLTNTNAKYPASTVYLGGQALYASSDHWVFNSSYFKIKQIQLGYNIPSDLINRIRISSLRLYVSLENFFTFTSYPGNDPESMAGISQGTIISGMSVGGGMSVDRVQYPTMKQVSFGINVSF